MPDKALADRVQDYCRSADIDTSNVKFIISKSADIIHQLPCSEYDLILIDGCHGFPSIFVDFYYAAKALKIGGTLIVDDMHIYTCHLAARFMQSDPGWNVELMTKRVAVGIKILDTIDNEWTSQQFVVLRSSGTSLLSRALLKLGNILTNKVWLPIWHFCLGMTRPLRARLGLRSGAFRRFRQKD